MKILLGSIVMLIALIGFGGGASAQWGDDYRKGAEALRPVQPGANPPIESREQRQRDYDQQHPRRDNIQQYNAPMPVVVPPPPMGSPELPH